MAKRFATPGRPSPGGPGASPHRMLVILCVVSLALFGLGLREQDGSGPIHAVRGAFQTVTAPVRFVGSAMTTPVQGLGNVFGNLTASSETLSELESENEQLKAQVAKLSEYQRTVDTLSGLLQLRSTYSLNSVAARVIAESRDSWSSTVTLDKGSNSGFAVGMPVSTATGVIGQISECSATTSTVRLITDEKSGVSATVQASGAQGQLTGSPDGTLRLTLVRTDQQVNVGDTIVTSGLGGVYPKGLPIGTVTNVSKSSGSMYYDISVEALAGTSNFGEVLVITSVDEAQQATDADAAAANAQDATAQVDDLAATTSAATSNATSSTGEGE